MNYYGFSSVLMASGMILSAVVRAEGEAPPSLAEILFQAGVVGAFIVFALLRGKQEAEEREKRSKAMDEERGRWVAFLNEERVQRAEAMKHGMEAVREVGGAIEKIDEHLNQASLRDEQRQTALLSALSSLRSPVRRKSK